MNADEQTNIERIGIIEVLTETDRVWPESWDWHWVRSSAERLADALIERGLRMGTPEALKQAHAGRVTPTREDALRVISQDVCIDNEGDLCPSRIVDALVAAGYLEVKETTDAE